MDRRDLACILLLTLLALVTRLPSLERVALNPDESQYEATASYLVATGSSAFALPYGTPTTMALYRSFAATFGPYRMGPVRVFVLLLCLGLSFGIYEMLCRDVGRGAALVGALVFLHLNLFFEGLSANREWFAIAPILLGAMLFLRSRGSDRETLLLLLSGLVSGLGLWFKPQALPLVLAVPAAMLLESLAARNRSRIRRIVAYAAGGATAVVLQLLPFALAGNLGGYLSWQATFLRRYVLENQPTAETAVSQGLWGALYAGLPSRGLFLAAYLLAVLALAAGLRQAVAGKALRRASNLGATPTLLYSLLLAGALFAVQLGHRFFLHYYLFAVPAVALLVGTGVGLAARARRADGAGRVVAVAVLSLLVVDRVAELLRLDPALVRSSTATTLVAVLYLAALAGLLLRWLLDPLRRAAPVLAAWLVLHAGLLVVQGVRLDTPGSLPHHGGGYPELAAFLRREAHPGDRLFVWGWSPEIYSLSRLEAASHFTITQYLVGDFAGDSQPRTDAAWTALLMRDLEQRTPRFVIDASRRSWTMSADGDPDIYDLARWPDYAFTRWLHDNYLLLARMDDCDVYLRRSG